MREKALNGDLRAIELLIKLSDRFNNAADTAPIEPLDADDRAILDDYRASLSGPVPTTSATDPSNAEPENPSDPGLENSSDGDPKNPSSDDPENPPDGGPKKKGKK